MLGSAILILRSTERTANNHEREDFLHILPNTVVQISATQPRIAHCQFGAEHPNEAERKFFLRGGDVERDHEAHTRAISVNTGSTIPPQVMHIILESSLDSNEVNSRRYAQVSISIYTFEACGKRSSSSGLDKIQKLRDNERTGAN